MVHLTEEDLLTIVQRLGRPFGTEVCSEIHRLVGPSRWLRIPAKFRVNPGLVYFMLHDLEEIGHLGSEPETPSADLGPKTAGQSVSEIRSARRWRYWLTDLGRARLEEVRHDL